MYNQYNIVIGQYAGIKKKQKNVSTDQTVKIKLGLTLAGVDNKIPPKLKFIEE